jgi:hypothetical protein
MRWIEGVLAMAIATVLAVGPGCGARTGFLTDESGDDGGTPGERGSAARQEEGAPGPASCARSITGRLLRATPPRETWSCSAATCA